MFFIDSRCTHQNCSTEVAMAETFCSRNLESLHVARCAGTRRPSAGKISKREMAWTSEDGMAAVRAGRRRPVGGIESASYAHKPAT
jgi:hypothetical protein